MSEQVNQALVTDDSQVMPEEHSTPEPVEQAAPPVEMAEPAEPVATEAAAPAEPPAVEAVAADILRSVVTADEVARRYDMKRKTIRRAAKGGALPARKAGRVWLMRRDDARALWGKKGDPNLQRAAGPQHEVLGEVVVLEEAAAELGLKKKRLRKAARSGELAARKAGKHWLMRRVDAESLAPDQDGSGDDN